MTDAKKIIWTENALQELERLLGASSFEIEEIEDALGGLDFPWPITIKSLTAEKDVTGETWSNLIIEFDEISGAGGYQVRMDLVADDNQYELITYDYDLYTSDYVNPGLNEIVLGSLPLETDYGIIITRGHLNGVYGGFDTWTKVDGFGAGISVHEDSKLVAVWIGSGVGVSTTISHDDTGSLTDDGQFILIVVHGLQNGIIYEGGSFGVLDGAPGNPPPNPASTPTVSIPAGKLVVTAVAGENDGLDSYHPDSTKTDYGFSGDYIRSIKGVFYGQGVGASVGYAMADGNIHTDFDMVITGIDGAGEGATVYFTVS
jgi:hypothetical protein